MIIDFHTHLGYNKIYPSNFLKGLLGNNTDNEIGNQKYNLVKSLLNDKSGYKLLNQMDKASITKAVLLILDGEVGLGRTELSIEEIYNLHFKILKNNPARFVVFAGIDPRRNQKGIELFKKGIFEFGFRGLKLYPPMGFSLDHPYIYKYLKICSDHKLPILIHCGPSLPTMDNSYSEQGRVFKFIKDYNNINFIMAHAGFQLTDEALEECLAYSNIYFDISGFQKYIDVNGINNSSGILNIFKPQINSKILFGSDWPLFNFFLSLREQIDLLRNFPSNDTAKDISDESLDNIFFKNALKILS